MDFPTITDGAPKTALCLLRLASFLADQRNHRYSAVIYSSASRATGTTDELQSLSLFKAAQQLFLSVKNASDKATRHEDQTRALSYLRKAGLLLQEKPHAFDLHMQIYALMESLCSFIDNFDNATKIIDAALEAISTASQETSVQLRWFCYFRSRAISISLADGNDVQHASTLALKTAHECQKCNDHLSAAAFYLVQAQIALSAVVLGHPDMTCDLALPTNSLNRIENPHHSKAADIALIHFVHTILQCFQYLRNSDLRAVNILAYEDLTRSYNKLRQFQKDAVSSTWQWLPQPYLSALTFFVTTASKRSDSNLDDAIVHAMTALARMGIAENRLTAFTLDDICHQQVSRRGSVALAVTLLENAARIRLTEMNLEPAATLIAACVDLAFPDERSRAIVRRAESGVEVDSRQLSSILCGDSKSAQLVLRSTALVLMAEYHNLRGLVSSAEISTKLLFAVKSIATRIPQGQPVLAPDNWHLAVSRLCVLTGASRAEIAHEGREGPFVSEEDDPTFAFPFVSKHVLAHAWFTVGVYHIRATRVIEAKTAVRQCLFIASAMPHGHDQLISNASVVLSGLILTHQDVSKDAADMLDGAMELARKLRDDVTIFRTLRQRRKLIHRVSKSPEQQKRIDEEYSHQNQRLVERQRLIGHIFTNDS